MNPGPDSILSLPSSSGARSEAPPPLGPTAEQWAALSSAQRERLIDNLIDDLREQHLSTLQTMAEGDPHQEVCDTIRDTLRSYFRQRRMSLYVGAGIPVLYPRVRGFSPDLIVVTDVPPDFRVTWMVAAEGKGVDLAMEVHHHGNWHKDFVDNVKKYARLGIREYFAYDLNRQILLGYRLPPGKRTYEPIQTKGKRYHSEVLGLDVMLSGGQVRFLLGTAILLSVAEQADQERERADRADERADRADERADRADERAARADERLSAARADAILQVLKLRGIPVPEELAARVLGLKDSTLLENWYQHSLTASAEEFIALTTAQDVGPAESDFDEP